MGRDMVYITDNYVSPTLGGIDRITYVMAELLHTSYGYQCYSVHALAAKEVLLEDAVFSNRHQWISKQEFISYIQQIGECIIVLQSPCALAKEVFEAKACLPKAKLVNVFHGTPGFETVPLKWNIIAYRLLHRIDWKWTLKQSVIQLGMMSFLKKYFAQKLQEKYARPYAAADKMVVLAQGIIQQYKSLAPTDEVQFEVIPNVLSFDDTSVQESKYRNKEVLVVARLDDWHKRISDVLKIWALVQKQEQYEDWTLRIVGDGIDRPFYEDYVRRHHIRNILFEGRQDPLKYYRQASVFMMTSACEGLPMTILEAQQNGCVPVVFDTFASLQDVVKDGRNGFIVSEGNFDQYVARLTQLMNDTALCKQMGENARIDCQRFAPLKVAEKWNQLFTKLA